MVFKPEYVDEIKNNIEIWVSLESLGFPQYKISSFGIVRNIKSEHNLLPSLNKGYYILSLMNKDKIFKQKSIHRLLAEIFIEKEEGRPTVDHKNRNKIDNDLNNLRWVTQAEQLNNRNKSIIPSREIIQTDMENNQIKTWISMKEIIENNSTYKRENISRVLNGKSKTSYNYKWEYKTNIDLYKEEEWKIHPVHENIYVSNLGRIRHGNTSPKYGSDCGGYLVVDIKRKHYCVHRLVIETFCGIKPDMRVFHKNGNKHDNDIDNLEYSKHIVKIWKAVLKIDKNTDDIIIIYDNITIATEENKNIKSSSQISAVCKGKHHSTGGYKWRYANDPEYEEKVNIFNSKNINNKKRKIQNEIENSKKKIKIM